MIPFASNQPPRSPSERYCSLSIIYQAERRELDARYQALKLRHRSVLDDYLLAKDVIATGSLTEVQLQARLEEEKTARKRAEDELSCCRKELQAFKDKALRWCESYMETHARLRVAEEQYRLDRKDWEDDLKDMREQRDQCMTAMESHRMDQREMDRQWQDATAKAILSRSNDAGNAPSEKRKVCQVDEQEGRGKLPRRSGKGKENGEEHRAVTAWQES